MVGRPRSQSEREKGKGNEDGKKYDAEKSKVGNGRNDGSDNEDGKQETDED